MTDKNQWEKRYMVRCPQCGHTFLPWECLSITSKDTNMKTNCICPNCKKQFERDTSYVNN